MYPFKPIEWLSQELRLLDQRRLPNEEIYLSFSDAPSLAEAIRLMVVRGAPAIGITAAYAVALSVRRHYQPGSNWRVVVEQECELLARSRPTAVNLFWALDRMRRCLAQAEETRVVDTCLAEALLIHQEDVAANHCMGDLGAELLNFDSNVLTHCNAGALATGGYGTALGVIRSAVAAKKIQQVYADETRPWFQGARLTAWELLKDQIPVTLVAEGAAAYLMHRRRIDWVIVGADRVAANGDFANKIGTYSAAVAACHHGVRFMVVAPCSTIDRNTATGADIPIEERDPAELLRYGTERIAAPGSQAWNPVFDVTPASLVDALVTEKGVILKPNAEKIRALLDAKPVDLKLIH